MTLLLSDPRVTAVPVRDVGETLVALDPGFGPAGALVRRELATRLLAARAALPAGVHLRVVEGYRPADRQQAIIDRYSAEIRAARPGIGNPELRVLTSRHVAPLAVAPHVAGAAVDVTLVGDDGRELDLGTAIDATPEQSGGRCYFAADGISRAARANRDLLARVLGREGLVNYPTEWWHYSYGDRYWALLTGAGEALYGPVWR
ncbi:M15 family metallopeptidase [Virgisporangium aurantiacum]|uniref:D-alanyl-D-alanine dipeptidase n=1 Tax=Virgisporangium aurantiacum TaxID=175570 RepID=A0A8J3ZHF4_9ACTN|nr:M15 family metallopeptidase [Virgisporangium aurantiacum]GIJ63886.1 D-alanyl-D-alanine dipeptidase [Virgisporangium aurantiacum]